MVLFFGKARTDMAVFLDTAEFPSVSILIAAFNEEKVIEQKIKSIFDTHYPMQKITVIVGSDASTDKTDEIINGLKQKFVNLHLIRFSGRVGKIGILNHLQNTVQDEYLILTDANVMFNNTTIYELLKYFKQTDVGIVAANIMKESPNNSGISVQEKKYLSLENKIKFCESNAFKLIMGAEGGCYAIRNKYFRQVPINFIVDDFFITLSVLKMGQQAIFNPNAICTEDVTGEITGEYKRKVRISSGNFQNLFYF
jgi:cellulose synthase/poly-beta-1,6-N-acetylglucosamine synthase-like glycosyltransferase